MLPDSPKTPEGDAPRAERLRLPRNPQAWVGFAVLQVAAGELRLLEGGEYLRIGPGDLVVLGPGAGCRIGARGTLARAVGLRIADSWLLRAAALSGAELPRRVGRVVAIAGGSETARGIGRRLHDLLAGGTSPWGRASRCLELVELGLAAEGGIGAGRRRPGVRNRAALFEALEKLESDPLTSLSAGEFAGRVGVSERQLSRLLRRELGKSFREVLTDLRLARAAEFLAASERPVIEVAAEAGFGSLSHFNTVFRSRTGRTPTEFRRASRSGAAAQEG